MKEKLDKIDNLGEIINDDADSDDEKEQKSNSKINDIISNISKKSKDRIALQKSSNFQEIDDFLVVLDNSEEYRKMIIDQAKRKIRRAIRKIKQTKDINKIIDDPTASKKYIINPEKNKFLPYFNNLIIILLYLDIIITPYEYFVDYNKTAKLIRIILFDLVFTSEIILTIFTSYYDPLNKYYVTDIKKIFKYYLYNGFIPNVIYVSPFYIISSNLEIIRLLKIYRYPLISNKTKAIFSWLLSLIIQNSTIISQIVRVINLFLSLCYILHICACLYCYLGLNYSNTWVWQYTDLVDNTSILDIYVSSYYFLTETFSSTGYGDLTPINNIEILFIMFCEILNCGLYAYLLSNVLDILTNKENSVSYKYRADLTQFEQWITYYISRLPSSSKMSNLHRHKIWNQSKRFHELYYDNTKNFLWLKNSDFFKQMRPAHRNEIFKKAFANIFIKFQKFFNEITKLSSKINIVINFKTSIQVQDTEIIHKGKQIKKIYFIDEGEIDIFYKNKKVNTLKEGDIFGLEGLLKNYSYSEIDYIVNTNCKYAILFYIEIELLIQDILNYDGISYKNLTKKADIDIHNIIKPSFELEIINEEKKEEKKEEIKENEISNENKDKKSTSINDDKDDKDEEIINKNEKNNNVLNIGLLEKLNKNYEQLEKAKNLIEESDLRISLIDKQLNFIKNYSKNINKEISIK
jgi:hypothetical protein